MTAWMLATLALLPALAAPVWAGMRGSARQRLVAVQLASTLTAVLLTLMSFAFDQPSLLDRALTLALLTLPGTLLVHAVPGAVPVTTLATDALLALLVAAAWIGGLGYLRLRDVYDRMHCSGFVAAGCFLPLLLAGFVADGVSGRSLKILVLAAVVLTTSAVLSHASSRALLVRDRAEPGKRDTPGEDDGP